MLNTIGTANHFINTLFLSGKNVSPCVLAILAMLHCGLRSRTSARGNLECAHGAEGRARLHRQQRPDLLGRRGTRSMRGFAERAGGTRTKAGWFALAAFSWLLSSPAALPKTAALDRFQTHKNALPNHPGRFNMAQAISPFAGAH